MNFSVYTSKQAEHNAAEADWGSLRWLASGEIGNAEGLTLGRAVIKAGRSNPPHRHDNCEEALYLLRGRLRHFAGNESVVLEPGDTLTVGSDVPHYAVNIGDDDADMIVAYSSARRNFQPES